WQGQPNQFQCPYFRNWMYTLQRVTGLILVVYIIVHVSSQRFGIQILNFNPMGKAVAHHANEAYAIVHATMASDAVLAFYIVGIASAVFHLSQGLWMFAIDWGFAISRRGQKYVGYACAVFGGGLFLAGANALLWVTRVG